MAINKAVAHPPKSHAGLKHCIEYVLRPDKVTSDLVTVLGPYNSDEMDKASVYQSFLDEKKQWNKDSGRMLLFRRNFYPVFIFDKQKLLSNPKSNGDDIVQKRMHYTISIFV